MVRQSAASAGCHACHLRCCAANLRAMSAEQVLQDLQRKFRVCAPLMGRSKRPDTGLSWPLHHVLAGN